MLEDDGSDALLPVLPGPFLGQTMLRLLPHDHLEVPQPKHRTTRGVDELP